MLCTKLPLSFKELEDFEGTVELGAIKNVDVASTKIFMRNGWYQKPLPADNFIK